MATPQQLKIMNQFLARSREALAPVRAEMAEWFRKDIKKRKGPKSATGFALSLIMKAETPTPEFEFDWYPWGSNRLPVFIPSEPVPTIVSQDDAIALNSLAYDGVKMLRDVALRDLVADAWIDADGFSFPKPLVVVKWPFESPSSPRPWIDLFFELLEYYSGGRRTPQLCFGPSTAIPLPRVSATLIRSVRDGNPEALQEWIGLLEQASVPSYPELLRWLTTFVESIGKELEAVLPQSGFSIVPYTNETAGWLIGNKFSKPDTADSYKLSQLLSAWNDLFPAIEWFLRRLGLPRIEIERIVATTYEEKETIRVELAAGASLTGFREGEAATRLSTGGDD